LFLPNTPRAGTARPKPDAFELTLAALGAAIVLTTGFVALLSPPNSADAMSYHLPRVIFWIQQRSVAFFPTPYLNQIMLQPVAEYLMLHLYLLSGGDRLTNLVQFLGYAGSIVATSSIAAELGLTRRAQAITALFCATLPNAILQASGAKNDCLLAFWLASGVLFTIRWARRRALADLVVLALAVALAVGTKATAHLFLPPFLAGAIGASGAWRTIPFRQWSLAAALLMAAALALNGPQYARNVALSGSPLGFDSAQADHFFRWRNDRLDWKAAVSNALRNTSEQLGARSETWNNVVYSSVLRVHAALSINPEDPATTWPYAKFGQPRNANHEADANNRWHLLIIVMAIILAVIQSKRGRTAWLWYSSRPLAASPRSVSISGGSPSSHAWKYRCSSSRPRWEPWPSAPFVTPLFNSSSASCSQATPGWP
jgi:4-amino-4-deoxy-L-arabinose transferase-like glycosyltransferase